MIIKITDLPVKMHRPWPGECKLVNRSVFHMTRKKKIACRHEINFIRPKNEISVFSKGKNPSSRYHDLDMDNH